MSATAVQVIERPILFSGPMVSAILEGRKSQTRRVIKDGPKGDFWGTPQTSGYPGDPWYVAANLTPPSVHTFKPCPYGKPGDRLWVREMFAIKPGTETAVRYAADFVTPKLGYHDWRPSIHMPRWASRITLEITDVRVERLMDISDDDIRAEGIDVIDDGTGNVRAAWANGWNAINEKRGYSWLSNPWVWILDFTKL